MITTAIERKKEMSVEREKERFVVFGCGKWRKYFVGCALGGRLDKRTRCASLVSKLHAFFKCGESPVLRITS